MKWIVFLSALLLIVPLVAHRAAVSPLARRVLVGLVGFSVFHVADINLISDETYRGDSTGLEVTTIDLMVLSLFIAQRIRNVPRFEGPKLTFVRLLYLAAAVASLMAAPLLLRSSFSVWKLLRMFFAFSVMAVELTDIAQARAALLGLGAGVLTQAGLALEQRYLQGLVRAVGSQPHPNSLAMLCNLVTPVALSLLLAGHARRFNAAVVAAGALCVILSLSRGGIMMLAVSTSLCVAVSLARELNARKLAVVGTLMVGGLIGLAKSIDSILDRFANAPAASEEARDKFNLAAQAMVKDHPFTGIGINMFSHVLDHGGYADQFELPAVDRNGIAHHIYWLTAAELGYIGLAAYLLLLGAVLWMAVRLARARGVRGEIALGMAAGLFVTYVQGTAEWIARQTAMSYGFWLFAGMLAALTAKEVATRAKAAALPSPLEAARIS
ncbi:MAG TPA: O-antigen ligase family protein [Polyangiaceae bacterium]|nr:O-antigen ligase family protein [Polyangiaceae bacterium]